MVNVNFEVLKGLPFSRGIIVNLPEDRTWWLDRGEFEIRAQVREEPRTSSPLVVDLTGFLTDEFVDNVVNISFVMTGAQTRALGGSGHYDVIMSDSNTEDVIAYRILRGRFITRDTITDAGEVV